MQHSKHPAGGDRELGQGFAGSRTLRVQVTSEARLECARSSAAALVCRVWTAANRLNPSCELWWVLQNLQTQQEVAKSWERFIIRSAFSTDEFVHQVEGGAPLLHRAPPALKEEPKPGKIFSSRRAASYITALKITPPASQEVTPMEGKKRAVCHFAVSMTTCSS